MTPTAIKLAVSWREGDRFPLDSRIMFLVESFAHFIKILVKQLGFDHLKRHVFSDERMFFPYGCSWKGSKMVPRPHWAANRTLWATTSHLRPISCFLGFSMPNDDACTKGHSNSSDFSHCPAPINPPFEGLCSNLLARQMEVWNMTNFDRLLFLDADTLILGRDKLGVGLRPLWLRGY